MAKQFTGNHVAGSNNHNSDDHIRYCPKCLHIVSLDEDCPNGCDEEQPVKSASVQLQEIFNNFSKIF